MEDLRTLVDSGATDRRSWVIDLVKQSLPSGLCLIVIGEKKSIFLTFIPRLQTLAHPEQNTLQTLAVGLCMRVLTYTCNSEVLS